MLSVSRGRTYAILSVFFFSSRRRHTRLQGDWSSDVCSSDLTEAPPEDTDSSAPGRHPGRAKPRDPSGDLKSEKAGKKPDRKSTRLNSSHLVISYAVFCLKKKKYTYVKRAF